jgi:hypothetical protein
MATAKANSAERGELADRLIRHVGGLPFAEVATAGSVLSVG